MDIFMTYEKNKSKYRSSRTFNLILIRSFQPHMLSGFRNVSR